MLTQTQKENRKKGIGASESAIVMGLSNFMSPYELWQIKTGKKEQEDISKLPQVHWGNLHEDAIAKEYERQTGQIVYQDEKTYVHSDYPFLLCHPDRFVSDSNKLLECKFAMFHSDSWGESGSDVVPLPYIIQVQHQLAVTGYQEADLAVLISGYDYRIYNFKRDEGIIEKIIEEVSEFWRCVENDTPPPLRDRCDAALAYPFSNGRYKEADLSMIENVYRLKEIKQELKQLEAEKKKLEGELTIYLEDAEGLCCDNQVLATWKANAKGTRVLRLVEARYE